MLKHFKPLVFLFMGLSPFLWLSSTSAADKESNILFHDSHFHLTNYIQEGLTATEFLKIMGDKVGRVALFGLPLQQKWDAFVSGDRAPDYYLLSDARLYYYSFTDAMIAEEYMKLSPKQQKRFDPMITGFNPTDMYAADHIIRVLKMYPGVFSGIGEFSIHKEFVTPKIAGHIASLRNKAFGRVLEVAADVGLVAILHCDINTIRDPGGNRTAHFDDLKAVLKAHNGATVIWAHTGLGRYVKPTPNHLDLLKEMLDDKDLPNVYLDISWDEVAKYIVTDPKVTKAWADLIKAYPDRFLFGTNTVAPANEQKYLAAYNVYQPLWDMLDDKTAYQIKIGNYERIFDGANKKVRLWELMNGEENQNAQWFRLIAKNSGKCLHVNKASNENGANITQSQCVDQPNVQWQFVPANDPEYFFLKARHSRKCAHVHGSSKGNGANITQSNCVDEDNLKWRKKYLGNGEFHLIAKNSDKCAHVDGGSNANGANITQWNCVNKNNLKWRLELAE
jgi:hypothetical protein